MAFFYLFFSYKGRIGRTVFLGGAVTNLLAVLTVFFVADSIALKSGGSAAATTFKFVLLGIATTISVVSLLSLHVRRIHDRNLNVWHLLPRLLLLAVSIWWLVAGYVIVGVGLRIGASAQEIGWKLEGIALRIPALILLVVYIVPFGGIRGTLGPNQYGSDPRDEDLNLTPASIQKAALGQVLRD